MEEKKMCCTCKYMHVSYGDEPCKSCFRGEDRSNWVDGSKPDKFKVGDLVVMKNDMGVKTIYIYLGDNWALRVPNYVLARSECNYVFSNYAYALINGNFAVRACNIEYKVQKALKPRTKDKKRGSKWAKMRF